MAREFFRAEHGRDPIDAREIAATIAKLSRPRTQTVAGYDLTFSPVKSVSTLWAVADPHVAAQIERAHQAAVQDALSFIDATHCSRDKARRGPPGQRTWPGRGLVHAPGLPSRNPDLHTHVAVANKVQTLDGRWLSIDGRVLFKATVAASETYNTALEHHLRHPRHPLRRTSQYRSGAAADTEIVGVDPALNRRWSARRASIESRSGELARQFQRDHGWPPTPVEMLHLAQQATLRRAAPSTNPQSVRQRTLWRNEAAQVSVGRRSWMPWCTPPFTSLNKISPIIDASWIVAEPIRCCRDGGATLHLADSACAGRSTTPNTRRQPRHRQTRAAESTCSSPKYSIQDR